MTRSNGNSRFQISMFVISLFLGAGFLTPAVGQITEATLQGRVTDSAGEVLVSAPVKASNVATGETRTVNTGANGNFKLPSLPPGDYTVAVTVTGFSTYQSHVTLNVGRTTELNIKLEIGGVEETVNVTAGADTLAVSHEGRLADTITQRETSELPLPQRDIFLLPKLSAGATAIPGAANSTKLSNSPVITVNGNRYRGNNYVLDGSMNTNPNNTGEPAIVPNIESIEEAQVQTSNFSAEFGRGNGAVINLRTKSGTNQFHGKVWTYHRDAALNARNFFAPERSPQTFNQFGGNLGGPIFKNKTFFFGSYEATRNAVARAFSFQVETPELRQFVLTNRPNSIAARLLRDFAAPAPLPGSGGNRYDSQSPNLNIDGASFPATGRTTVNLRDYVRFDQYLIRIDHSFNNGLDKLSGRWIGESQSDQGGTSSSPATLGQAIRGMRGPFNGTFGNLNLGHIHVFGHNVNDLRFSLQTIYTARGDDDAVVPQITITGITAPFGDVFNSATRLRTFEMRDTMTLDRGNHTMRFGGELRRIFKGIAIGPPSAGAFSFNSPLDFINDNPFRQTLTVDPASGQPVGFPRYFTLYESGLFVQDDWKVSPRLNVNLGLRHDYFGTVKERNGLLSSIILGPGESFNEQLASAGIGHVDRLYHPEKLNLSPRIGVAYDPFGDGKTSIRAGFSLAFQPHHGQSISGARALPPDAVQVVSQPGSRIGTRIIYNIPVPFNPEFARGLNPQGGVNPLPGETVRIRPTGFVINPVIKTQYSESFFLSGQREFGKGWIVELGYNGTLGINLERIDDVNRFAGDLLDGREDRINPNFGPLLFVTNGVNSSYHGGTVELRRNIGRSFTLQANYRFSKWLDTSSDTSTGQFQDNSEPGKGAMDIACLRCERARSLFDIPHRFSAAFVSTPRLVSDHANRWSRRLLNGWEFSGIATIQSGRPFSVWSGASAGAGGDFNRDGGGGAVGGGFYDRPNAPAPGAIASSFSRQDFINGLFPASAFPRPVPGQNGTLGRNTFRGPGYTTLDLALGRTIRITETKRLQLRLEAFNALNNVNLFLPNVDLAVATNFGKSNQAFEPRNVQISARFAF
jgi:Carboxypeptidase regulatory-like domain/TonB dependent receptor